VDNHPSSSARKSEISDGEVRYEICKHWQSRGYCKLLVDGQCKFVHTTETRGWGSYGLRDFGANKHEANWRRYVKRMKEEENAWIKGAS